MLRTLTASELEALKQLDPYFYLKRFTCPAGEPGDFQPMKDDETIVWVSAPLSNVVMD